MERILTGIKPTNSLHIGNYCGSIINMKNASSNGEMFVFVADLHALTTSHAPRSQSINIMKYYLSILPNEYLYYIQSDFPQVCEISWYLSCVCSSGQLHRMTQFKSQSKDVNSGYLFYPVLMAADIISVSANLVAVGEDQRQHVELARSIVQTLNHRHKLAITEPRALLADAARIKNLQDATKKMSKSDEDETGTIFLDDSPDIISKKISRARTDSLLMPTNIEDIANARPEIYNLCKIFSAMSGKSFKHIEETYGDAYISIFKKDLQQCMIEQLNPIRKFHLQMSDEEIENFLDSKKERMNKIFNDSLALIKSAFF
jgi:tryptophanyl-tRNA synthetase